MSGVIEHSRGREGVIWSFLSKLLTPLHAHVEKEDVKAHPSGDAAEGASSNTFDDVQKNVRDLLGQGKGAHGAHIRVIGLQVLREKVGAEWPRYQRVIHMVVENVLAKSLAKADRYLKVSDEIYLIAFADCEAKSATERTDEIAKALLDRLLGAQDVAPISVQAISGQMTLGEKAELNFEAKDGRTLLVASPLDVRAEGDASVAPGDVAWRESKPSPSHGAPQAARTDMEGALARAREAAERLSQTKIHLGYVPIWDVKKEVVSAYAVVAHARDGERRLFEHQALGPIPSDGAHLALDMRCLRQGITDLADLFSRGERSIVCVQVRYSSLQSKTGMRKILDEAARVPDFLRKYLAVVIVDVPPDVQLGVCSSIILTLRQRFTFVFMRLPSIKSQLDDFGRLGMDVATVQCMEPALTPATRGHIQRLLAQSTACRVPLTVEYVANSTVARDLAAMGVAYMTGPFISEPFAAPTGIRKHGLGDFPLKTP